jgi:hypothetical protein
MTMNRILLLNFYEPLRVIGCPAIGLLMSDGRRDRDVAQS